MDQLTTRPNQQGRPLMSQHDSPMNKALEWVNNPLIDEEARNEIQNLIDQNNTSEITDRFYKDIEFGTGGLRSIIGMGSNRINKYTIRKITQALATTIIKNFPKTNKLKVAICYDSRRFSYEFAKETCNVLAGNGIEAFLFKRLNPVPLLSFAVRSLKANAGIMITASHNPINYNGYKIYWDDGAQVIAPYDTQITEEFKQISSLEQIKLSDFNLALDQNKIKWIGDELENSYQKIILENSFNLSLCKENGNQLKIIYTPIHGTGKIPCTEALKNRGLTNFKLVQEQAEPNSEFPTVISPNPEDPSSLKMALELMEKENADLAFGTDPDTDRLGAVIRDKGQLKFLNGNQVATLLLHYILINMDKDKKLSKNSYVFKSIVTSELQHKIADKFKVHLVNTLTGFKWMCGKLRELEHENPDLQFIFASEESFGLLTHSNVRDKDAVSALALVSEMALWYKLNGKSLLDGLDDIFKEFGLYQEDLLSLSYQGKTGAEKIERIVQQIRQKPLITIGEHKVVEVEDYLTQEKYNYLTNSKSSIDLPKSNVIGLTFSSGHKVYLRPSGTEPKIKYYFMIRNLNSENLIEAKTKAEEITQEFKKYFKDHAQTA